MIRREATAIDRDGYWYRLVHETGLEYFLYSYGTKDMNHRYKAHLKYLGRGSYSLTNRSYNGYPYEGITIKRRHRKRCEAYPTTIRLIKRMLE